MSYGSVLAQGIYDKHCIITVVVSRHSGTVRLSVTRIHRKDRFQHTSSPGLCSILLNRKFSSAQTTDACVSVHAQLQANALKYIYWSLYTNTSSFESQSAPGFQSPYFVKCVL